MLGNQPESQVKLNIPQVVKQIGDYGVMRNPGLEFGQLKSDSALYEGSKKYDDAYANEVKEYLKKHEKNGAWVGSSVENKRFFREAFLRYLATEVPKVPNYDEANDNGMRQNDPKKAAISMENFLGKTGSELYTLALEEEMNSKEYMNAVLDQSTERKRFENANWAKRPIVFVGGPSASGKTYAAYSAIEEANKYMEKAKDDKGVNQVIFVDGGIIREVSQMRKIVLKMANNKGYTGISDLQGKSNKILESAKKRVFNYAINKPDAGMVIPETFSKFLYPTKDQSKVMLEQAIAQENATTIFTRVVGKNSNIFQKVVAFMGSSRAWKRDHFEEKSELDLNSKPSCESKKYGKGGFKPGVLGSKYAEKWFIAHTKNQLNMAIVNDLILVQKTKDDEWTVNVDPKEKGMIEKISRRMFDKWQALPKESRPTLESYMADKDNHVPSIIKTSAESGVEIALEDIEAKIGRNADRGIINEELKQLYTQLNDLYPNNFNNDKEIQKVLLQLSQYIRDNEKKYKTTIEILKFTSLILERRLVELAMVQQSQQVDAEKVTPEKRSRASALFNMLNPFKSRPEARSNEQSLRKEEIKGKPDIPRSVTLLRAPGPTTHEGDIVQPIDYTNEDKLKLIKTQLKDWEIKPCKEGRTGNSYQVKKDKRTFTVHTNSLKTTDNVEETCIAMLNAFKALHPDGTIPNITTTNQRLKTLWVNCLETVYPETKGLLPEEIDAIVQIKEKTPQPAATNEKSQALSV